jgi:hypothetical protein
MPHNWRVQADTTHGPVIIIERAKGEDPAIRTNFPVTRDAGAGKTGYGRHPYNGFVQWKSGGGAAVTSASEGEEGGPNWS